MVKGSSSAFDKLYLRYFDSVVTHVLDITKDRTVAEDIVQDAFFKLWQRREMFSHYEKIAGWLFVTTYNSSLNHLRRILREKHRLVELCRSTDEQETGDFRLLEEQFRLMEEAIEQLPPQRKRVFQLCKLEGFTYDQAAAHLSISKNTVKEHIAKGGEFIREYISKTSGKPLSVYTVLFISCMLIRD